MWWGTILHEVEFWGIRKAGESWIEVLSQQIEVSFTTDVFFRWIGRGGPRDHNIAWPPRSPDLTPMDFYLWSHIKSKVYVKNYQSLADLKTSITAAFREVTAENVSASVRNLEKRLKMVIERAGAHIE